MMGATVHKIKQNIVKTNFRDQQLALMGATVPKKYKHRNRHLAIMGATTQKAREIAGKYFAETPHTHSRGVEDTAQIQNRPAEGQTLSG